MAKADEAMQEQVKEKYMEMQMVQQQLQTLQQQIEKVQEQLGELEGIKASLEELKDVKEGTELLIPLTNGIFAKAKLDKDRNLLVNVGANMTVPKTIDQVKEMLTNQAKQLKTVQEEMMENYQKIGLFMQQKEQEIAKLVS